MTYWLSLIVSVLFGGLLGLGHFGGLWVTVRRVTDSTWPKLLLLGSFLARIAVVHSAFGLSEAHEKQIQEHLAERIGEVSDVSFESDADVGFGVELRIGERKVAWSLASYLDALKTRVRERLDAELRKGATPAEEEAVAERGSTNE